MKKLFSGAAAVGLSLLVVACSGGQKYTLYGTVDNQDGDEWVYMLDMSGNMIDSAQIVDGEYHFRGSADKECIAYLCNNDMSGFVILEEGDIEVTTQGQDMLLAGTPQNDEYNTFLVGLNTLREAASDSIVAIVALGDSADTDSLVSAVTTQFVDGLTRLADSLYAANPDNLVGVLMMNIKVGDVTSSAELEAMLEGADPYIVNSELIQMRLDLLREMEANADAWEEADDADAEDDLSASNAFIDFTGVDPATGDSLRLSDYVGRGKPVLVDFWASWCGPCRRETPYVKAVAEQFAGRVTIVGVGVSDTRDDHRTAVADLGITWPQILDVNGAGVQAYQVQSIPFIVLFAADGTLYATGLRGEDIATTVGTLLGE